MYKNRYFIAIYIKNGLEKILLIQTAEETTPEIIHQHLLEKYQDIQIKMTNSLDYEDFDAMSSFCPVDFILSLPAKERKHSSLNKE